MSNLDLIKKDGGLSVITLKDEVLFLVGNDNDGFIRASEIMGTYGIDTIENIVILSEYENPIDVKGYLSYDENIGGWIHTITDTSDIDISYNEPIGMMDDEIEDEEDGY